MKILIVEDDRIVAETLQILLSEFNYAVDLAEDGLAAWEMTEAFDYDLVVLDVGLPVLDGLSLCRKLRDNGFQQPILLLTGQGGAHQKAIALNAGADDYVVKPFDPEELIARVQALLRRGIAIAPILTCSHLALDPNSQRVSYRTNLLSLTPKEFAILELLLRHPEKTFSPSAIIDRAWSSLDSPGEESVRVHIKDLRQKLRDAGAPKDSIQTVYRRGYRLNPAYSTAVDLENRESLTPLQIAELKSANEQLRITLDKLRATQAELQQSRDKLEFRVAERTTELIALNSQLQQEQQQSRAREEHLQLALDALQAATAEVNLITEETTWSDRMYQFLGYAPGEVEPSADNWRDRVHPDDLERIEREFAVSFQNPGDAEFEYRAIHPDGSIHWLLARKHDFIDESGRIERRLWVVLEIADRKQLESTLQAYESQKLALQFSEQRFQHFAERSHFIIWMRDAASCQILYISPAYEQIWGRSCQSLMEQPKSWLEAIHPDDREIVYAKLEREKQGETTEVQYRIIRPDSSIRWIWDRGFPIHRNGRGNQIFGGVTEDVTDRKQAEIALQQQLERSHLVAEVTQAMRQSLDLDKILQVTVDRVRQLLQSDRVIILQFDSHWQGSVVAESAISDPIPMLSMAIRDPCFPERYIDKYPDGKVCILDDSDRTDLQRCYVELLKHFQIKANLIIPILQTEGDRQLPKRLWGLLIAHQCTNSRHWESAEVSWLQEVAERLGVAIEQSVLYERTRTELLERQRAESELRHSESRYRLLFDSNPNPIWVLDAENLSFLAVNQAAVDCYGYSRAEFSRMTVTTAGILPSEVLGEVVDIYASVKSQQRNYLGIWRHTKRDGSQMDVEVLAHSFTFEQVPAYLVLLTDITDRLQAEGKIREQAALLDIASDAIFVRDWENRILYWNRGAERLYGWSAAEAIGESAERLLSEDSAQILAIMKALPEAGEWRGELTKVTKAGRKAIVEARWTLVRDEAGQPKAILAVNTDVTEKKQLETQFYRAQRLESLGTLASGIAHDLNNVFTPILAISQMMLSKRRDRLEERFPELMQVLQDSARRGASLVGQILTFARGMEGKRIPVQISSLLKEIVKVIESTFPKSIAVELEVGNSLGLISADPTHIHQILLNLCVNARDAMPDGGILHLNAEKFWADELFAQMNLDASVGNYIAIAISDTGTGISAEVQERMFEPFFTTKSIGQGTGLGLSVVLGMVKNYGGFLEVSSDIGKGTTITVYLPAIETGKPEPESTVELPQGRGELILIVDDDLAVRRTNQSLLESYQYRTLVAADGVEAIATYTQHQNEIEAVLLDLMMPNMDGLSTMSALIKIDPAVKIIAASGLSSYQTSALNAGAKAFLAKPYTLGDVLSTLSEVISS